MEERVIEMLVEHFEVDPATVTKNSTFSDLGIDSLDVVEFIMELEDEFEIEIQDSNIGSTVGELVAYIEEKKA